MAGKGGGSVGAVTFPTYMQEVHEDWIGNVGAGSVTSIDQNIIEIMNTLMSPGDDSGLALATLTVVSAALLVNDEGFTLADADGVTYVFKYSKDGGGTTNHDYQIAIITGYGTESVRNVTKNAIRDSAKFTQPVSISTDSMSITQLVAGPSGNQSNIELVINAGFTLTNFEGGTGGSPYALADIYDPDTDLTQMQTQFDAYKALVDAMTQITDWQTNTDAAIAKANNTYTDIDIASTVTAIVTSALTDAANTVDTIRSGAVTDVNTLMDAALAEVDIMVAAAPVQNMIAEYQRNAETAQLRAISRFAGGFADINAVQSSAFLIGMAMMEAEHLQSVDQFSAQLALDIYNTVMNNYLATHGRYVQEELGTFVERFNNQLRSQIVVDTQNEVNKATLVNNGAAEISRLMLSQIDGNKLLTSIQSDISRVKIVAKNEETKQGVLYDVEDWLWDAKVFQYGSNVLSGISTGGQVLPEAPSQMATTLSGAMAGAAIGASTGNPYAAVAGTIIGGVGGYLEGN